MFAELKRRNVFRVGAVYLVTAWLVAQVADLALDNFDAPGWVMKSILLVLAIGFPVALVFAWAFEKTPEGLKRQEEVDRSQSITPLTGRKLDRTIITVLGLAVIFLIYKVSVQPDVSPGEESPATTVTEAATETATAEPAAPAVAELSVAVLPFVDMSPAKDQEYFSDGIAEEILNVLAQVSQLQVAARTSAFQFKGKNQDIQDIARQLGVAWVLEGSVRKAGDRVRVTAQLIRADNGFHAWSETYDRRLDDIFAIQDEISEAIAQALKVTLKLPGEGHAAKGDTHKLEAYEAYLMGRHLINQRTTETIKAGLEQFKRAVALDPDYALAYADQAIAILLLMDSWDSYGDIKPSDALAAARPLVDKALSIAPDRPEILAAKGFLERVANNFELALDYLDRSLAINPANGEAQNWRRMTLSRMGRYNEILNASYDSVRYDPMSRIALSNHALELLDYGRKDEAQATALRLRELDSHWGEWVLGSLARNEGRSGLAAEHFLRAFRERPQAREQLAYLLSDLGLYHEAARISPEDKVLAGWARGGIAEATAVAESEYREHPGRNTRAQYAGLLWASGRIEEMYPFTLELWQDTGDGGSLNPRILTLIAAVARSAGDSRRATQWRTLAGERQDKIERSNRIGSAWDWPLTKARMAAYDGDGDAALAYLAEATAAGFRAEPEQWRNDGLFSQYKFRQDFQDLRKQWDKRLAEEREYIANLLCGDEPPVPDYEPAPETCTYTTIM